MPFTNSFLDNLAQKKTDETLLDPFLTQLLLWIRNSTQETQLLPYPIGLNTWLTLQHTPIFFCKKQKQQQQQQQQQQK